MFAAGEPDWRWKGSLLAVTNSGFREIVAVVAVGGKGTPTAENLPREIDDIIFAISILTAATVQLLRAQQASAGTPVRAPFAAGPGLAYNDFTYGGVRFG